MPVERKRQKEGDWAPGELEHAVQRCRVAILDDDCPATLTVAKERFGYSVLQRALSSLSPQEYEKVLSRRAKRMPRRSV